MSQSPDYVVLCVLACLTKMSRRQVSAASTYMCMPSLGGKFLPVNASNPSSKWVVRYAISSSANVESYVAVYVPRSTIFGFGVSHNHTSQRCERALHVVVLPVHVCICQYFWHHIALSE